MIICLCNVHGWSWADGNLFLFKKTNIVQAREFSSLQKFFFKQ